MDEADHNNQEQFLPDAGKNSAFSTTQWGLVLAVQSGDMASSMAALEQLCQRYWPPIYSFIRRRGFSQPQAEDLTQAFFAYLLDQDLLKKADREKGKFRTFLLMVLGNFLANEWHKGQTMKRGGQTNIISLDHAAAEKMYGIEPADALTPEKLFDRQWAALLIQRVLDQLKEEYAAEKKAELFAKLEPGLTGELTTGWQAGLAGELNMTAGAVRVALHRLRRRFGELLRAEIAQTVSDPTEIDEEIRQLFSAISH
jgi:RNA polymerase sigma-70 factor (ECF subfamily)